jgi:hypothetical protein
VDDEETEDDEDLLVMEGLSALAAAEPGRPMPPKPKRGRGRPPGVKNGQGSKATAARAAASSGDNNNMHKRGRGRPPGVKNGQVRVWGDGHWQTLADDGVLSRVHVAAGAGGLETLMVHV